MTFSPFLTGALAAVDIVIIPTLVQGENAAEQIAEAIRLANEHSDGCLEDAKIDVLIVGRGGGSSEDLLRGVQ